MLFLWKISPKCNSANWAKKKTYTFHLRHLIIVLRIQFWNDNNQIFSTLILVAKIYKVANIQSKSSQSPCILVANQTRSIRTHTWLVPRVSLNPRMCTVNQFFQFSGPKNVDLRQGFLSYMLYIFLGEGRGGFQPPSIPLDTVTRKLDRLDSRCRPGWFYWPLLRRRKTA